MNDGSQLSKDVRVRLRWVREPAHCNLDEGETEGPDIGRDGVSHLFVLGFPFDSFRLKIGFRWASSSRERKEHTAIYD